MKIRITRTSTVEYAPKDQDLAYYADNEIFNIDQIALKDLKDVEDDALDIDDIDGGSVQHEYKVVLVADDLKEHEPDYANTERDLDLFPDEDDLAEIGPEPFGANDSALQ